eukprot:5092004-Pleurochrysis_carterae.AAC.3
MTGRGDGTDIKNIFDALKRAGYDLDKPLWLSPTFGVTCHARAFVLSSRISARLAVHLWDKLELSRSQCETKRHLLSFVYDPTSDNYVPIKAWENPDDPADYKLTAVLPGRVAREKEYGVLSENCGITVSAHGCCERDAVTAAERLYFNEVMSMRANLSEDWPAQPMLYMDGTRQALGKGLGHTVLCSADFDGDCKQSSATLEPFAG